MNKFDDMENKYLIKIKSHEDESERVIELVKFLENDLANLYEELDEKQFINLMNKIIEILEDFRNLKILDKSSQKIFYEMRDYIQVQDLDRILDCFQYSLARQVNILRASAKIFDKWKVQNDKCMLVEILKSHSLEEQKKLSPINVNSISNIWDWYYPIDQEKFLSEIIDSTSFNIGIKIWNRCPLGIKLGKENTLVSLLKNGLENFYDIDAETNFEEWVNKNSDKLQNINEKLFDEKILKNISLSNLKKVLTTPEIQEFIVAYKENIPIINYIVNSLKKDETKKSMIDLFEQIKPYEHIIGQASFDKNSNNEEVELLLKIFTNQGHIIEDGISLNRRFEIASPNFELQLKLWEMLPKEIRRDNIDILQKILKSKFGNYLPENLDQSFFINLNNSIELANRMRVNSNALANGQLIFLDDQKNVNMIEQMNSSIFNKDIMAIFPFDKMIQILPHLDIEAQISKFGNDSQFLKIFEYVINNSVNWNIELNALLENMQLSIYEDLMQEILNCKANELPLEQLAQIFMNGKNHFAIETIDEAEHFNLIRRKQCLEILNGEEPDYMSLEFGKLSSDNKMRFALLQLSFGIDIYEATELVKKYGTDIEDIDVSDEEANKIRNIIATLKIILSNEFNVKEFYSKNMNRLLELNSNYSYSFPRLEAECLNLYANLYNKSLGVKQEKIRTINYNGTDIEVYEVTGDFNILIRLEQNVDVENGAEDFIDRICNNVSLQVNGNCKTYIGQNFINFVQVDNNNTCLFGYMNCKENCLYYASSTNIKSGENNVAFSPASAKSNIGNGIELRMPSRIIDNSRTGVNETTTKKWQYNSEDGRIDVGLPDFIIYVQETNDINLEEDEKWKVAQMVASKLGKPILIIPREKCAQREYEKLQKIKQKLLGNEKREHGETDEFLFERLIVEFNNNREGIITSPVLKEKYFTDEQNEDIIKFITERINSLKDSNSDKYEETLKNVCQILRKEIDKFYSTSFDRTDTKLDIGITRKHLEPYEEFLMQNEIVNFNLSDDRKNQLDLLMKEISKTDFYDMNEVHSIEHIKRVMLFSAILASNERISKEDTQLLLIASAFHDSGRSGKDGDDKHAEASAKQLEKYFKSNPKNLFGIDMSNLAMIQTIIHYHEYKEDIKGKTDLEEIHRLCGQYGVDKQNFEKVVKLSELLKDADALDRARFGLRSQNSSALDAQYLKSETARSISMIKFAEDKQIEYISMEKIKLVTKDVPVTIKSKLAGYIKKQIISLKGIFTK